MCSPTLQRSSSCGRDRGISEDPKEDERVRGEVFAGTMTPRARAQIEIPRRTI